jgi:hypothetical protein
VVDHNSHCWLHLCVRKQHTHCWLSTHRQQHIQGAGHGWGDGTCRHCGTCTALCPCRRGSMQHHAAVGAPPHSCPATAGSAWHLHLLLPPGMKMPLLAAPVRPAAAALCPLS